MEKTEKTQSLRKLARFGFENYVARAYRDGRLSLREAAGLLQLSLSETMDVFEQMGIKGNIGAQEVLSSLESLGCVH